MSYLRLGHYSHPLPDETREELIERGAIRWAQGTDDWEPAVNYSVMDVLSAYFEARYPHGGTLDEADTHLARYRELERLQLAEAGR